MTFDLNYIYNTLFNNNNKIQINKEDLQNQLYEDNFYEIIDITGDGNYFLGASLIFYIILRINIII